MFVLYIYIYKTIYMYNFLTIIYNLFIEFFIKYFYKNGNNFENSRTFIKSN